MVHIWLIPAFVLSSSHPYIKKYQNKKLFENFHLEYGEIEWNDYELAFPILSHTFEKIDIISTFLTTKNLN